MTIRPDMSVREYFQRKAARKLKRQAKARELWGLKPNQVRTPRKVQIAQLDHLFSICVRMRDRRERGRCPFHAVTTFRPIECVFHIFTRAKFVIRWDLRNGVGACHGCNKRYEHDQTFVEQVFIWYKAEFGVEAFEALRAEGNGRSKFSLADLEALRDGLKKKISELSELGAGR